MTDLSPESLPPAASGRSFSAGLKKFVFVFGILFLFWLVFGQAIPRLFFTQPQAVSESPPPSNLEAMLKEKDERIAALSTHLDRMEAKLKTFEEMTAGTPKSPEGNAEIDAKITALQEKIEALKKHEDGIDDERASAIEGKLQAMESKMGEVQSIAGNRLLALAAFGQMKDAFARGEAFAAPLAKLKTLTDRPAAQEAIAQLTAHAEKGVPTEAILRADFEALIPKALAAQDDGHSLLGALRPLVRIRKVGDPQGADDQAVIARAETGLEKNDLSGALKELAALSPPVAAAFAPWIAQAEARRQARAALDALELALAAQ